MAMSLMVFFLLSPNPGAFTAHTWSPTFSLQQAQQDVPVMTASTAECTSNDR